MWLVLTKRTRVWFDEKGNRTGVTEDLRGVVGPYMSLGGKKFFLGLLKAAVDSDARLRRHNKESSTAQG